MSTIITIAASDQITNSRADINTNFANLNTDKVETSAIDTDTTLAANSDSKVPSQKAVKAYVDANAGKVFAAGAAQATTSPTTIAHGLGSSPTYVRITGVSVADGGGGGIDEYFSMAVYTASTQSSLSKYIEDNVSGSGVGTITQTLKLSGQTGTIAVDATNITITWTGSVVANLVWEAVK